MAAHHGQCSVMAFSGPGSDGRCTPTGDLRVSASEIAARVAQVSATKTVANLLSRCERHCCPIMFKGCMECGYLFTDIDWNRMPVWDPNARAYLELDKKRRHAALLLAAQIRSEAAKLQYERDALCEAGGKIFWETVGEEDNDNNIAGWSGNIDAVIEPPPVLASINDEVNSVNKEAADSEDYNNSDSDDESNDEYDEDW